MRWLRARYRLPHIRCGHYRKHAPHRWRTFYQKAYCHGRVPR